MLIAGCIGSNTLHAFYSEPALRFPRRQLFKDQDATPLVDPRRQLFKDQDATPLVDPFGLRPLWFISFLPSKYILIMPRNILSIWFQFWLAWDK